jgi:BASS family bile acid:Na+ symporter
MPEPYAIGLIFLGLAPCAPFLPLVAEKAGGDMAYVAAFMLLAAVGTVILMPLLVPILVKGFAAGAWTIAKPLVLFIALPLAVGVVVRYNAEAFADRAAPFVKMISMIDTVIMLALVVIIYGKDYISAVGTYAIGAQIVYGIVIAIASYTLAFGLPHSQKSVLALGLTTRNIGAALAPLISAPGTDNRSITMCTLAVPITVLIAAIAAKVLATRSSTSVPVVSEQAR